MNNNVVKYLPSLALALSGCSKAPAQKPNILLIVADDLGMGTV